MNVRNQLNGRRFNRRSALRHKLALLPGLTVTGMLFALPAHGQTAAPAPAEAASAPKGVAPVPPTQLESVNITARRQTERLQDVPLSVTAITAQVLQDSGSKTLKDIAQLAPGITVNTSGAESNLQITIRGLTNLNGGAGDPNVAIFLDGIYLANPSAISLGLIDMERIEIIKGPVSALYGRNAYGGAINYVSKKPGDVLAGSAAVTVGNDGIRTYQASVSAPIQPGVLGFRLTAGQDESQGTYKDDVNGLRAGGFRKKDIQGSFEFTPTKELAINASFYYGDDFFDNPPAAYVDDNCGATSTSPASMGQFTQHCGNIDYRQHPVEVAALPASTGAAGNKRQVEAGYFKVAYDLGLADGSALLGYNDVTQQRFADFTGHRDGIPFVTNTGLVNLKELFGGDNDNHDTSLELRLSTKRNQPLRGSVGTYWYSATNTSSTLIGIDGAPLAPGQTVGAVQNFFLTPDGSFSQHYKTVVAGSDRIFSPFGNIEYDIVPALTAAVELRHTHELKTQDIQRNAFVKDTFQPYGPPTSAAFSFNNYRTNLRYKLTPDAMVYVSAADGTKAGGFNSRATIPSEIAFQPEKNTTYELGGKASFLDRKLTAGLALYHITTKDLQIQGPSDDPMNVWLVTKNFGGTKSNGLELDLAALPVRGVTLTAGVGYSNPKFKSGSYDFGDAGSCATIPSCAGSVVQVQTPQGTPKAAINLDGFHVPRASTLTGSLGAQYNGRINDDWSWFTRGDFRYESKQYSAQTNYDYWGSRKEVNLNGGVESGRYRISAFIRNLTNNETPDSVTPNTRLNDFIANPVAYLPDRRTYGVTVAVQY